MRLKELREERNLSQQDVAKAVGGSQSNLAKWEKGIVQPSADSIIKLADFFKCTTDYLLGREDDLGTIAISPSPALDLTEREKKLLFGFRRLSKATQDMILRFVAVEDESEKRA